MPEELQQLGLDRHSLTADPQFVDPTAGDYRVKSGSPAERIGFVTFPMDRFGIVSPQLKARTKTWSGLGRTLAGAANDVADTTLYHWQGATLRNLVNLGRESAIVGNMELSDNRGVLIKAVAVDSAVARTNLPADAVIVAANDVTIGNIAGLSSVLRETTDGRVRLKILTASGYVEVGITAGGDLPKQETPTSSSSDIPTSTRPKTKPRAR